MFRPSARHLIRALTILLVAVCGSSALVAQSGPPRVSPQAKISQSVGAASIEIVYSRPSVKGRTIWGELVPLGEVWRTGANEATTFTLSHDATIGGHALAAGSYALFTVPSEGTWKIVFNQVADQWGAFSHDPAKDALTLEVPSRTAPMQETFAISFPAVDEDSATVQLAWERKAASFDVAFDTAKTVLAKAEAEVAEAGEGSRAAYGWARYFQGTGEHLEIALAWANAVTASTDHYWTQSVKARILAGLSRNAEAKKVAAHAMTVIDAAPNPEAAKRDAERLKEEVAGW